MNIQKTSPHGRKPHSFYRRNGLLLVFLMFMMITWFGQAYTGWHESNQHNLQHGLAPLDLPSYLISGHFIQSTFENWESEFFQMGLYVLLTVFLYQQGSAESKDLDKNEAVDREPKPHAKAPWPVKRGGLILTIYQNSLGIAFALLFLISFFMHAYGTMLQINEDDHKFLRYWEVFLENRFWFESFQNWQSEFLSVAAIIYLSIYLRQKGSPESKPVDAPHDETGK